MKQKLIKFYEFIARDGTRKAIHRISGNLVMLSTGFLFSAFYISHNPPYVYYWGLVISFFVHFITDKE